MPDPLSKAFLLSDTLVPVVHPRLYSYPCIKNIPKFTVLLRDVYWRFSLAFTFSDSVLFHVYCSLVPNEGSAKTTVSLENEW